MNSYRIKKEKQRILFSTMCVLGSVILIFMTFFILNLFKFEDFTEYTGPVKITFGSPDSIIEPVIKNIVKTETVDNEIHETNNEIIPEPVKDIPVDETKSEPIIKEDIEYKEDSKVTNIKEKVITKPKVKDPVPEPKPVVQKGRESGNSHETSFESSSSKIGRRAYFPIYQFMPLPTTISFDVFSQIAGDITGFGDLEYNRNVIGRYYSKTENKFILDTVVMLQDRPEVWGILENAGYDMENPEYKKLNNLQKVIIVFEINSNSNGLNAIKSSIIESSSGSLEIDEAVLYGFKQSTYSNSTNEMVKGRFKYSFE